MTDTLTVEQPSPGVALVRLNRPERLNALNRELVDGLYDLCARLERDVDTRVVVLTGAGRGFCAGMDIRDSGFDLPEGDGNYPRQRLAIQETMAGLPMALRRLPQPVIAAVNGAATGGGLALALGADIRICARSARFNAAFVRIGLSGCDMGVSYHLPRVVGMTTAALWMLTGRLVGADEALRTGLVAEVVDDDELVGAALGIAGEIMANTPFGIRMTKQVMWTNVDAASLPAAIELENRTQILASYDEDRLEALAAFQEKRPPTYRTR